MSKDELEALAVHVVLRSTGEYSDRSVAAVCVLLDEEEAKRFVLEAGAQWRAATQLHPRIAFPERYNDEAVYKEFCAKQNERVGHVAAMLTLDPDSSPDQFSDEEPYYYYETVPLRALAHPSNRREGVA